MADIVVVTNLTAGALPFNEIPIPNNSLGGLASVTISDYATPSEISEDNELNAYLLATQVSMTVNGVLVPPGGASPTRTLLITFEGAGPYVVGTQVGGRRYNQTGKPWTLLDVTVHREFAGSSGSTILDLNIDGVTAYTTQANRPTVAFGAGNDAVTHAVLPDILTVATGSYLTLDLDVAEGGAPRNITAVVTVQL